MNQLLQTLLTDSAQRRPDAVVLVMGHQRMTYGELETTTNQLAHLLRERGLKKGNRVGVLMPKSPEAILSFIGILKAGCIYVPFDPAAPPVRAGKIIQSCENLWILAGATTEPTLDRLMQDRPPGTLHIGWMSEGHCHGTNFEPAFYREDLSAFPTDPPDSRCASTDPAHILFTSGSTGTPKGVVITHSNVLHFVEWAVRYFGIEPSDRNSGHSPLHFDLSTFDIYGTLAAGAQLHLVPPELNILPTKLAEFIRGSELTQWFSAPSALGLMAKFDAVRQDDFPTLKRLLWCGEVFPTPALIHWMRRLPRVTFTNLYGPTEATIASSYYTIPTCPADDKAQIPIGKACDGEALLVLDDDLRPVPPEQTGWLYIQGVGLSPGYWRDPEKTAAAFVKSPHVLDRAARLYKTGDLARLGADGLVYFLGRADTQIKCRGHRIELGEVETVLNTIADLSACAVVAIDADGFEGKTICCAFVPRAATPVTPAMLRDKLRETLPVYMLPGAWKAFDRLPQNANGKIDRKSLKEQFEQERVMS
ncbi:MAG: amino acid adenylation [Phycisphaerales bacterium]|nr:amino acid adenylation [Phycisphaerales bacterium]